MQRLPVMVCLSLAVPSLLSAQEANKPTDIKQITNSIGMKLTLIPSGEFMMGSGESIEAMAAFFKKNYGMDLMVAVFKDEHPQHRVRITKPFYLGTYHVTRGQFREFVKETGYLTDAEKGAKVTDAEKAKNPGVYGSNPRKYRVFREENPGAEGWDPERKDLVFNAKYSWRNAGFAQTDEHPVVIISWNDAAAFCKWLSPKEGKTYRLPTEAEWEYACRAGTTTRYYSGDDPESLAKVGNVADATATAKFSERKDAIKASDGHVFTSPVGSFKPNAFGLYDMHGNAWQWCLDWYGEHYYAKSPTDDPTGPGCDDFRVLRGGSWYEGSIAALCAVRSWQTPCQRNCTMGFRVARTQ